MGVPFVGFPLYKYVVGGVEGDRRNIFHERFACGFLRAVLEQQFQASLELSLGILLLHTTVSSNWESRGDTEIVFKTQGFTLYII